MTKDIFNARSILETPAGKFTIYRLESLEAQGYTQISRLPFSVRILLEGVLRNCNEKEITRQDVLNLAAWLPQAVERPAMPFIPARVLMQDLSGVPVINDLAAMRAALARLGGDPRRINPRLPVDVVIDHSIQVDFYGAPDAMRRNAGVEFERNRERYEFLHWAQKAFENLRVVPPSTGIVHQVNLEYLSPVVASRMTEDGLLAYPDSVVGTDSHTTMINGLGVIGWGVGGIEAVAAMLGQPIDMLAPQVIGFKLSGSLPEGVTPTDLTLTITQLLRQKKVVGKFIEFYGSGLSSLPLADRAMIANMSPENGATVTFFPVDEATLQYLRLTGRPVELVEAYCKAQQLFRSDETAEPAFSETIELDLGAVEPSLAGPKRPHDRLGLGQVKSSFRQALTTPKTERGFGLAPADLTRSAQAQFGGQALEMRHGAVVIAAITSCTNTSNPFVMVAAGLLAKKAVERGLRVKPYVKTSLSPGSRVVTRYLEAANLMQPLAELGFHLVGYGCMTCIGNTGPLPPPAVEAIQKGGLVAAAVLSGNRNFEGRISPHTAANYLASPPLVVAYALAGSVDLDLASEPLGVGTDGQAVYLREIWPSTQEVQAVIDQTIHPGLFESTYRDLFSGNEVWERIESGDNLLYEWQPSSTYLQEPPFFLSLTKEPLALSQIEGGRALAVFGDSITTDHISPAGSIAVDSPAGEYLIAQGVEPADFNTYGTRRGNDRVLTRGAFANIRLKNLLLNGVEGGQTLHLPSGRQMRIYEAALKYKEEGTPLIILAGKEYGSGSSRDWAAKGPLLLGVKAILAESFERIHRSNLLGMGVIPLQFEPGQSVKSLGLSGRETFSIYGLSGEMKPNSVLKVHAAGEDGRAIDFEVIARLDTPLEIEYYRNGGILNMVILNLLDQS